MDSSKYADHANWMTSSAKDALSTVGQKDSVPANELVLVNFDALSTFERKIFICRLNDWCW